MSKLKTACVQFQHAPGDKAANLSKMLQFVHQARKQSVQSICFPECCVSGYWHLRNLNRDELINLAETIPSGPTTRTLVSWAKEHNMTIGAGLVEIAEDGSLYNSYVVAMPDGRTVSHRKLHCFVSKHMRSGDQFTVFDLPSGWKAAILICYDNNLIENVRACALAGAQVVFAPPSNRRLQFGKPVCDGRDRPFDLGGTHRKPSSHKS